MPRCAIVLAVMMFARLGGDTAGAQALPNAQRAPSIARRALVVVAGEGNFDSRAAANDLADVLVTNYGFTVTTLEGGAATREAISRALEKAANEGDPHDLIFLAIDLPAHVILGTSFLVPADGNRERPQTLIRADEVLFPFFKSEARPTFLMMPVCSARDRSFQAGATQSGGWGTSPPGATVLTYCAPSVEKAPPVSRIVVDLLRRPETAVRIPPAAVAEAIDRTMPFANIDLRSGFLTSERPFTFDRVRDRVADVIEALDRNPTPLAIQRAVTVATESPASRRSADIDRVSAALANVAEFSRDTTLRLRALQALGQLGSQSSLDVLGRIIKGRDDARVRKTAVEAVARIGGASAAPIVRPTLADSDAAVREAGVRAVTALHDTSARGAVAALLRRDPAEGVRVASVQALTLLQVGDERLALVQALKDESAVVRRESANALSGISADVASELIAVYPTEPEASVQQAIIYALARVPHNQPIAYRIESLLRSAVRSSDKPVREAAVYALGTFTSPEAKAIVRTALSDDSQRVKVAAIQSVAQQRNSDAVPQLVRMLDDDEADVRGAAVDALGKIGDPRAADPLVARLKDENEYVRLSAQRSLSTLEAGDALTQALRDVSPEVRVRAIGALAASNGPVPVAALIQALGDDDYGVRQAAIEVLNEAVDQDDIVLVISALGNASPLMKMSALELLGNLADRTPSLNLTNAEALLDEALRRPPNPGVLAQAIITAAKLGGSRWLPPILAASSAPNVAVRGAAAQSLGRYSTPESIEALQRLAKDPMLDVQAAAIGSLRQLNIK
jgi:HEAT repeat protein